MDNSRFVCLYKQVKLWQNELPYLASLATNVKMLKCVFAFCRYHDVKIPCIALFLLMSSCVFALEWLQSYLILLCIDVIWVCLVKLSCLANLCSHWLQAYLTLFCTERICAFKWEFCEKLFHTGGNHFLQQRGILNSSILSSGKLDSPK